MNVAHAILPQQILPVPGAGDQGRCVIGKQGFRVGIKGDGGGFTAKLRRQCAAGFQQRLMPQMATVKNTPRVTSSLCFHTITGFSSDFEKTLNG